MSQILLDKREGFAIVTLNRPDAMNALAQSLIQQFVAALDDCQQDDAIRVLIITGNGKAFCAGFDLKELGASMGDSDDTNPTDLLGNEMARAMEAFDGPIIAAVNGHAVTGGFELALACDVLLASENARFADTHARVGILPGWGLSQKLPRLIGLSRAKQVSFTGLPVFAQQAYEWGLVNEVLPADRLLPRAIELAEAMVACVPNILLEYKSLIEEGYSKPYSDALQWEEALSIESAKKITASIIESRRKGVLERGRNEKGD